MTVVALALVVAPVGAQTMDYQQQAARAFARKDYEGARRNLRLAVGQAKTPDERIAVRRKIAVTFVFEGDYEAARKEYTNIVATTMETTAKPDAHDYYALAAIAALQQDSVAVRANIRHAAGIKPVTPYAPMFSAIVWGHLGDLKRVAQARAAMDAAAAGLPADTVAQEAAVLARVIHATMTRHQDVARRDLKKLKGPSMQAFANAFLANALRRDGDPLGARRLDTKVRAFNDLNIYSAVAWQMIK